LTDLDQASRSAVSQGKMSEVGIRKNLSPAAGGSAYCGAADEKCSWHAVARLRPIPGTDRFELFYWSNIKGRWRTFGNLGRLKLMLESAHEIVETESHVPHPAQPMKRTKTRH
jgi:hypothetical protein